MISHRSVTAAVLTALLIAGAAARASSPRREAGRRRASYCNPIALPYRFQLSEASRREAADPTVITHRGEYWLFPSKSGGYWHSRDLLHWSFVEPTGYPIENYAPTVVVINERVYLATNDLKSLFVCDDLAAGRWTEAAD